MGELPDLNKMTSAQGLRMLAPARGSAARAGRARQVAGRVAGGNGERTGDDLAAGDAPEIAAKQRDLMFDRKKLIHRAPPA